MLFKRSFRFQQSFDQFIKWIITTTVLVSAKGVDPTGMTWFTQIISAQMILKLMLFDLIADGEIYKTCLYDLLYTDFNIDIRVLTKSHLHVLCSSTQVMYSCFAVPTRSYSVRSLKLQNVSQINCSIKVVGDIEYLNENESLI